MSSSRKTLSVQAKAILELIAQGHTYDQILTSAPNLTYMDIFRAAQEALDVIYPRKDFGRTHDERVAEIRKDPPRAYEPWSNEEELTLTRLMQSGRSVAEIAAELQRRPSAIRSRIRKMNRRRENPHSTRIRKAPQKTQPTGKDQLLNDLKQAGDRLENYSRRRKHSRRKGKGSIASHRSTHPGDPRSLELGGHPVDGEPVVLIDGRYGPYLKHGKSFANVPRGTDISNLSLQEALTLLETEGVS